MVQRIEKHGLQVDGQLARFVEEEALPGTDVSADEFWSGFASLTSEMVPRNRDLLARREALQGQIKILNVLRVI